MREATVYLSDEELEALGIDEFVASVRAADLEQVTELQCRRPGCLLVVDVADPIPAETLSAVPNLEWWEHLACVGCERYLCKLAIPAFDDGFDPSHETRVSQEELEVTGDGVEITMVGAHDELSERVTEYGEAGADLSLLALTDYSGPTNPLDSLTARQREVLTTAFDMGYFEVPRRTTTEDLAAVLDVDASTVREHLQRAQRNLLTEVLRSS